MSDGNPIHSRLDEFFRREENKAQLYSLHVSESGVGPLDGTCYVLAKALSQVIPDAQICLLSGWAGGAKKVGIPPTGHHFLIKLGEDAFLDAEGVSNANEIFNRWRENENIIVSGITVLNEEEEVREAEKMQTIRDLGLIQKTSSWLRLTLNMDDILSPNEGGRRLGRGTFPYPAPGIRETCGE